MIYDKEKKKKYDKIYRAENKEKIVAYKKKWYWDNKQHELIKRKECYQKNKDEKREKQQRWLNLCRCTQGNKCSRCGAVEKPYFHHVLPATKEFRVSHAKNFEKMLFESYKCVLLCNSCHFKLHTLIRRGVQRT